MAFPGMNGFFINLDSMDRLRNAPDNRSGIRHTFPYPRELPSHMEIRYHHGGEMAWSAPEKKDLQVLILISRVPGNGQQSESYRLWAFSENHIPGLISDAGKISAGTIRAALGIPNDPKNPAFQLKSEELKQYGAEFFSGSYEEVCARIDGIGGNEGGNEA